MHLHIVANNYTNKETKHSIFKTKTIKENNQNRKSQFI